ncbi:hypothetical protein JWG44_00195 [Leptospira sp. 201903071]|nr:hypothetical protein [Leptospira ainazelensis]MBM9498673.1 hypothetical protein [Leptospira ainazelensis]
MNLKNFNSLYYAVLGYLIFLHIVAYYFFLFYLQNNNVKWSVGFFRNF